MFIKDNRLLKQNCARLHSQRLRAKLTFVLVLSVMMIASAFFVSFGGTGILSNAYGTNRGSRAGDKLEHNGVYKINLVGPNRSLAVWDSLQYDGAAVGLQRSRALTDMLTFRLEHLGGQEWSIMALHSDMDMMVSADDYFVYIQKRSTTRNQVFRLVPDGSGNYIIYPKSTNYTMRLGVNNADKDNKLTIGITTKLYKWRFVKQSAHHFNQVLVDNYPGTNYPNLSGDEYDRYYSALLTNGGVYKFRNLYATNRYLEMANFGLSRGVSHLQRDTEGEVDVEQSEENDMPSVAINLSSKVNAVLYDKSFRRNQRFRLNYLGNELWEINPVHAQGNRVLTVQGGNVDKAPLTQNTNTNDWGANSWSKSKSQRFKFIPDAVGHFTIATEQSNFTKYLMPLGTANNTKVVQSYWSRFVDSNLYRWALEPDVDESAVYRIVGANGEAMTATSTENGTQLQTRPITNRYDTSQLFSLKTTDPQGKHGMFSIEPVNAIGDFALSVQNGRVAHNTSIVLNPTKNSSTQRFRILPRNTSLVFGSSGNVQFKIMTQTTNFVKGLYTFGNSVVQSDLVKNNVISDPGFWIFQRVIGSPIGKTYFDDQLPQPELDNGAYMGEFLDHKDTLVQEGGRNKYLMRAWRHKVLLNTAVKEYEYHQVLPGETKTISLAESDSKREKWSESIKYGLSIAIEHSVEGGIGLDVFKFSTSIKTTVTGSIETEFGYEKEHTYSSTTTDISTVTNQSNLTLSYRWQMRVAVFIYYVQVFELQYYNSTYLNKMKLVEVSNQFKLGGKFGLTASPYYLDVNSGKFLVYDKDGRFSTDTVRYV